MNRTNRKSEWRLRPLLFVMFMLLTCLFVLAAISVIYISVTRVITEQTSETRIELLAEMQKQLTSRIREVEETALSITTHPKLIDLLSGQSTDMFEDINMRKEINELIDRFLYTKANFNGIHIYTDRFVELSATPPNKVLPLSRIAWQEDLGRLDRSDSLWIQARMEPTLIYSTVPVISFISKIYTYNGEVGGYLAIYVTEEAFSGLFTNRRTAGDINVYDGGGRLILNSPGSFDMPSSLSALVAERNEKWALRNEGYETVKLEDVPYLVLFSDYNQAQWRIVEAVPMPVLLKQVDTIRIFVLGIGLISLLLSFPMASYLSKRIIKPLPEMLVGFKNVQNGHFASRLVEQNGIVEFRQLAEGFNRMTEQLQNLMNRLDRENRAKRKAELAALQSQINPHFLYNTLDMINWAAARQGAADVSLMAAKLARLFRISLSKGKGIIPLREELEHCLLYIQIQQTRFPGRFGYVTHIDPSLSDACVPKLILQPFVENALIHGFVERETRNYEVIIRTETLPNGRMSLIVEDNGCGFADVDFTVPGPGPGRWEQKKAAMKESGSSGYGIDNVRQRIRLYFPDLDGDAVVLENRSSGGARVRITIPIVKSWEEPDRDGKGEESG